MRKRKYCIIGFGNKKQQSRVLQEYVFFNEKGNYFKVYSETEKIIIIPSVNYLNGLRLLETIEK